MILETIRLVSAALQHAAYGVNALLPTIPRAAGDDAPPAVVTFLDPTTRDEAARGDEGPDWPALLVVQGREVEADPEVGTIFRDAEVEIVIAYITRDADSAATMVAANLTLRAVVRTLAALLDPARDATRDTAEAVTVIAATRLRLIPWHTSLPGHADVPHSGALAVRFHVRDTAPLPE